MIVKGNFFYFFMSEQEWELLVVSNVNTARAQTLTCPFNLLFLEKISMHWVFL